MIRRRSDPDALISRWRALAPDPEISRFRVRCFASPGMTAERRAGKRRAPAPNGEFVEPDQADATCPVPCEKIFRLTRRANHFYNSRRPVPKEGRCATSSTREGMRWTRRRRKTSGASRGRRSRVVLTPRRWRQVSWRQLREAMVAKEPGHQGEREGNR